MYIISDIPHMLKIQQDCLDTLAHVRNVPSIIKKLKSREDYAFSTRPNPFTISDPRILLIDVSALHKVRQSTDFEALNL